MKRFQPLICFAFAAMAAGAPNAIAMQAWDQPPEPAWSAAQQADPALTTDPALVVASSVKAKALAAAPSEAGPLSSSAVEMNLWLFISSVRAQQAGRSFALLENNLRLLSLNTAPVSTVPLPGAAWLLVMGLLGFAGMRLTAGERSATGFGASPRGEAIPA